jgi:hypothetical protein
MTLKTDMAADLTAIFLNTDEFADTATYTPNGAASGFSVTLLPGDIDESFLPTASGEADRRMAPFTGVLSLLRAGILAIEGTVRDPRRLDSFVIASGAYAGTWVVERYSADLGGGVILYARYEQRHQVAGDGVLAGGGG